MDKTKMYSEWEYDKVVEEEEEEQSDQEEQEEDQDSYSENKNDEADDDKSTENKTVKLDDGTEVSIEELRKGYMRQSDYTKKTQELSDKQKNEVEAAQKVVENKSEYPDEDVKAAKYFLKIALNDPKIKEEFGLVTKKDLEAKEQEAENRQRLDGQFSKIDSEAEKLGIKPPSKEEVIEYMKENQIYNALSAFKEMKEDDIFEAKLKKAQSGKKGYDSEKTTDHVNKTGKGKKKQSMDEFLDEELEKMDTEKVSDI